MKAQEKIIKKTVLTFALFFFAGLAHVACESTDQDNKKPVVHYANVGEFCSEDEGIACQVGKCEFSFQSGRHVCKFIEGMQCFKDDECEFGSLCLFTMWDEWRCTRTGMACVSRADCGSEYLSCLDNRCEYIEEEEPAE